MQHSEVQRSPEAALVLFACVFILSCDPSIAKTAGRKQFEASEPSDLASRPAPEVALPEAVTSTASERLETSEACGWLPHISLYFAPQFS